ncbi:MAG: DUF4127 family protein [Oscillibacter sp.]|nr:DUF4127 family protein [Oscillibacter sp.]
MKKRILAAAMACALLAGCGQKRTEPQPALPAAEGQVIAYVPLDDRPDNVGRVVYLAESLGYVLEMPEADDYRTRLKGQPLNSNGTQYGDRADLFEWVLAQEENGCDRYVLFMDQLLSGGLVNSRSMAEHEDIVLSDGTALTEYEAMEQLLTTLAADPDNRVWLLDSVMRLAPTVGYDHWDLDGYNALRSYGMQSRPELESMEFGLERTIELYGKDPGGSDYLAEDFGLTGEEVAEYLSARCRKLELADRMLWQLEQFGSEYYPGLDSENFHVLIGIDDSSQEDSIQKNEIAYLRSLLRDGDALLSGVDDLAFKAVAKLYLEEIGWDGAAVSVKYFGGTEDQPACAYDYQPLENIVAEHFDFFDLQEAEPGSEAMQLLVLTQPADEEKMAEYYNALIRELNGARSGGLPTILIDAGNGRYGTAFHEALTEKAELGWLISYSGFLDMAIVTGTALSHGVARYAFLQQGEQTETTEKAFARTLADSILKDFCYKHIVRNDILSFVRGDLAGNADNFWQPDIDRDKVLLRLERGMDAAVEPVIENLERSNFISVLSGGEYAERGWGGVRTEGYYFPWDRAFEIEMEILLGDFTEPHEKVLGIYYK